MVRLVSGAAFAAAALAVAPAPAGAAAVPAVCNPNATLLGFTDALNKTTFDGTAVAGLSALAGLQTTAGRTTAAALVDNQGTTQARLYDLALSDGGAQVTGVTRLRRKDGTPFTGTTFDGEGLVRQGNGRWLASSETEPVVREFTADGRELRSLPVPDRFRVAPAGQATTNLTFEGLGLSADGHTLWAGMEGPLSADGVTADGRARLRLLKYRRSGTAWSVAGQVGYVADPGLGVSELQVVNGDTLLVLERGFVAGVGNTVRVYQAFLTGADDVTSETSLSRDGIRSATKRLVVDLGDCPASGAANPGTQKNPLLDNVEGMALGRHLGNGQRELRLISDDNFSAGQVTRLYRLAVRLRPEPTLAARAVYPATLMQPGPTSGNVGVDPNNGQRPPFAGQPIPGISGALRAAGGKFWGMPDNGFGSQGNSGDFLLRVYLFNPHWKTSGAVGTGQLGVDKYITLHDPDRKIPFPIHNEATSDRLLTGDDFDVESIQRAYDGTLWFGEEFGPYLLHTDANGRVLDAPIPLAGLKAPQSHEPGDVTMRSSRGWEALAASADGKRLYAIPEVALLTDTDKTLRHVYEFDATRKRWTGRTWTFHAAGDELQIGDAQVIPGRRILFIERDDLEGPAAPVKLLKTIALDGPRAADGSLPETTAVDLLRLRDPLGVSAGTVGFGLGDPFSFPLQSVETVLPFGDGRLLIANDNNFPDSNGRVPGTPDDLEAILVDAQGLG